MAWTGTNGWPENSIQVLLISHVTKRSSATLLLLLTVYLITILTPFFSAMLISLFAIWWYSLPPQISFVNTSQTELTVFGLVCNFRAAEGKRAGLIESCMSSYDLWWNRIDAEARSPIISLIMADVRGDDCPA